MSIFSKTLCISTAAALGAGITYFLLKQDKLELKEYANDLWDKTKDFSENIAGKVDAYFEEPSSTEPATDV